MSASERVNVFGFSAGELGWRRDGWESEARECEPNRHNIVNIYRGVSVSFHSRLSIRNTHRHTIRSYENKAMLCTRHSVCATQYRVCAVHGTADATPSAENAMYAHGVCVCLCMQERDTPQTTASTAASMVLECMHFFLSIRFEKEKPWHNGALFFRNTDARSFPVRFQLCAFSLFYFATFALVSFVIPRLWTVGTEIHRTDICIYRHTHIYMNAMKHSRDLHSQTTSQWISRSISVFYSSFVSLLFFGYRSFAIELLFQNCLKFRI